MKTLLYLQNFADNFNSLMPDYRYHHPLSPAPAWLFSPHHLAMNHQFCNKRHFPSPVGMSRVATSAVYCPMAAGQHVECSRARARNAATLRGQKALFMLANFIIVTLCTN